MSPFVNKLSDVQQTKQPRVMNASEEIVWLREHVLSKGPKNNPAYADAAKRLAELHAELYPGVEEDPAT
jgi:hypothetical protein